MMLTASFFSLTSVIIFLSNYISFNVIEKTKEEKKIMKKKLLTLLVIGTMSLSMTACGSSSDSANNAATNTSSEAEQKREEVDISSVTSDPDACKGKYVTFYGIVFQTDESDTQYFYQVYTDTDYNNSVLLYVPKELVSDTISNDDFISVVAKVDGAYSGQTVMRVDTTWAKLTAEQIEKSSYVDTFGKAHTTWDFLEPVAVEQQGIHVEVTKVEFADDETRIYVTATNNSSDTVNLWTTSAKVIQDGQQYEQTYGNYLADYPELSSDILPGASSSGILCFDALDANEFQFYLEGASDNWDIDLDPFTFTLSM